MRIQFGLVLGAVAAVMLTTGALAEPTDAERDCFAADTSADQKIASCSTAMTNAQDKAIKARALISRGNAHREKKN